MRLFKSIAAAASIALVAAPAVAGANSAASLSVLSQARASTSADSASEQIGGDNLIYTVAIVAGAGAIAYLFADEVIFDDEDEAESP
ncbi:hypothetical protein [Sphingosinithalassobacter sp. LHW66-3]|uniref:hypothetical protein n=1 Tax=Sphingosinithalassobacter sp. LHW66-3 TaxID=3424718 RepID=UPI003D6B8B06